jgi:hypothetical protein
MNKINRNTDPMKGPPDGVEARVNCVVTQFSQKTKVIKEQDVMPCRMLCAYSDGTVSVSIRTIGLMVTLRIDELYEILKAGAEASHELTDSMPQEYKDAELEARWRELDDIPFDESDEAPSGLVLAEKWWLFPKGADRNDIWGWFNKRHSKGVAYLLECGAQ